MTLTELSIKRPILIIVFYAFLGVIGIFSIVNLRYELLPKIATPIVSIATIYPSSAPQDVEQSITKPIENAVAGVENIKRISSTSNEGISTVMIEFRSTAKEESALESVQRKVNEIVATLPQGAKTPIVSAFALDELPVLTLSVKSNGSATELSNLLTTTIRPRLAQLSGVAQVNYSGTTQREIRVQLSASALRKYNVAVADVLNALQSAHLDIPSGSLRTDNMVMSIRSMGKLASVSELGLLRIKADSSGSMVTIADVGQIADSTSDTEVLARMNGAEVITMNIQKQRTANSVDVSELVRRELKNIEEEYSSIGLSFQLAYDSSSFTLDAVNDVKFDLFLAIGLVALVMLVFLHSLRDPMIVLVAIPTSLIAGFIGMYALGFSLNLMTLLAMSLAIGILVDDAMVVHENIHRHLAMGKEPRKAALDGRNEIGFSALSITLVDVVVFLPISFVPGLIGSILREFALTMVISTLASLIVSFTLTPMLASRFAKHETLSRTSLFGRFGVWFENVFNRLISFYKVWLVTSLRYKGSVIVGSFALLLASLLLPALGIIGSEFMTQSDRSQMSISVELQPGTSFSKTNTVLKEIEKALQQHTDLERVNATIGSASEGMLAESSPNSADISVTLKSKQQRSKSQLEVQDDIKKIMSEFAGVKVRISTIGIFGSANDAPIIITLSGTERDSINKGMDILYDVVRSIDGVDDVRTSRKNVQPELSLVVNHQALAERGMNFAEVAPSIRTAFAGNNDTKMTLDGKEVPVRVQLQPTDRMNPSAVKSLALTTTNGLRVSVEDISTVKTNYAPAKLERRNRNNSLVLYATVHGRASGDIGADIKERLATQSLPQGVNISYEGDLELQDDAFDKLGLAFIAAILFVYLVMVALYNSWITPFIVLFSVPVAIVGALIALALTGESLSIFSLLGCIMLVGLVAKNAILLVDSANQLLKEGYSLSESVIKAGATRLRPIVMTTIAMVVGMLPVALAKGAGAEWKNGLAWVLIGGLTSSMFLTLFLVPSVFVLVESIRLRFTKSIQRTVIPAILILLLMIANSSAFAKDSTTIINSNTKQKLTLQRAVALGLERNSAMRMAKLEEERSVLRTKEANSGLLPTLSASGQYIRNIQVPVFFFPTFGFDPNTGITLGELQPIAAGLRNTYQFGINASMPLYQRELTLGKEIAKLNEQTQVLQTKLTKQELRSTIQRTYLSLLTFTSQIQLIEASLQRAERTLAETRSLLAKGMAGDVDTLRAYLAIQNLKPTLTKVRTDFNVLEHQLALLLGFKSSERPSFEYTDSLTTLTFMRAELLDDTSTKSSSISNALQRRPDVQLADNTALSADRAIALEESGHYPSVGLVGSWQLQSQSNDFRFGGQLFPNTSFIGLTLNIPIFSGFRVDARVEQAEIAKRQADEQRDYLRQKVALEIEAVVAQITSAEERVNAQRLTIQAGLRTLQLIRSRYAQGVSKLSEVLDAELAVRQSEANYLQSVYDYHLAGIEYQRAVGIE
jgi:hydrophobe/amphiphile efflux-1 (HAE1) family protein